MIPKIIHYVWLGKGKKNARILKCIESWKKYMPDYEIIEWNETNLPKINDFFYHAYENKKWAFASDVARLFILYNYGGIYMDTDVEVIKSLDKYLENKAFSGFESDNSVPTGIMASEKGLPIFRELIDYYTDRHFIDESGNLDLTTNVTTITNILKKHGLKPCFFLFLSNTY